MPLSLPFKADKRLLVHDYSQEKIQHYYTSFEELKSLSHIKRIQYSTAKIKQFLIVDIDDVKHSHTYKNNPLIPTPNIVIENRGTKFGKHLIWILDKPVWGNTKLADVWKNISRSLAFYCGGDKKFTFHIGKNPYNEEDFIVTLNDVDKYPINRFIPLINTKEFKEYWESKEGRKLLLPVNKVRKHTTKATPSLEQDEGFRNSDLFEATRKYAYTEIRYATNDTNFKESVLLYANNFNSAYKKPLEAREVKDTANSIVRYCLRHKNALRAYRQNKGVLKLDKTLLLKEKQKLGAEYTAKAKANKMEIRLKTAILEMKHKGLKINASSLSKYASVSRPTISKYKYLFE